MWAVIAAVVIVLIIVNIRKSMKTARLNQEMNVSLIRETISLLKMLQEFSRAPVRKDKCGLVMIIPVNGSGDLYNNRSDRLKISLLMYEDDIETISLYSRNSDITSRFRPEKGSSSFSYVCTTFCSLHGEYKRFMPDLYAAVQEAFPDVAFEFDGSRVLTNHL